MPLEFCYVADITKAERDEHGDLIVVGTAASNRLDIDRQIADPSWLKSALPAWARWGNVREQHSKIAAGIGLELEETDATTGTWHLKSAVIDEGTARKVEKGVLKGYSIGIKNPTVVKDAQAPGGRITGGEIVEISLVDRPANPDCLVTVAKAAGPHGEWEAADTDKAADGDEVECPTCEGDGKIMAGKRKCPDCDGDGKVSKDKADELAKGASAELLKDVVGDWPVEVLLGKRQFTDAERKELVAKGQAMPGGGYPIPDVASLKDAIRSIGRAKDPAAAKAWIKRRAKDLKREDLIPDTWKGAEADLEKADDDTWTHDPAQLQCVRDSIAQLMQAELDELMKGEPELWDLSDLLQTLQTFTSWWQHEAAGGEVPSPNDQGGDMDLISLGVSPDLIKAAGADTATEADRQALRADLIKALGIATPDTVRQLIGEGLAPLKEMLDEFGKAAAPGGPVTTRTNAQASRMAEADNLRAEAARYREIANGLADRSAAAGYREKAAEAERAASKLAAPEA